MSVIYLDNFFSGFADNIKHFSHVDDIPTGCDVVGIVFYKFDRDYIVNTVTSIKTKTKKLLVVLNEPIGNIVEVLQQCNNPDITFFGDAVLNQPADNFHTSISWFISPDNYYAKEPWAKRLLNSLDYSNNKPFKFDCLLGIEKIHRDVVNSLYQQSLYQDSIMFSYLGPGNQSISKGIWNQEVFKYATTSQLVLVDSAPGIERYAPLSAIIPDYIYNQSFHSVVCETTYFNEFNQYTEKVAKPILAQRIFVAFCGQWYLKNLRRLGFKTFDSIIDESYDSEPDLITRYQKAWTQVEYLCQVDGAWARDQVKHILEHNQQHFLKTDWHSSIKQFLK